MSRALTVASLVLCAALAQSTRAAAATITAYELLADTNCALTNLAGCVDARDLTRDRFKTGSGLTTEVIDATIVSENSVNANFGIWTNEDAIYTHVLTWIGPLPTFQTVTLTLLAYDADPNIQGMPNDPVFADVVFELGDLLPGTISTTMFSGLLDINLLTTVQDGLLVVRVDTSPGGGPGLDRLNLFSSKLEVTYEDTTPSAVPEPASLTLLGLGLAGLAGRRWRQRKAT